PAHPHNFCMPGTAGTRCWSSFSEAAQDFANSRLWGGIHFDYDDDAGLLLGQQVASFALASSAFDTIPEPATWAMLIVGFGAIGAVLRRRRAMTTAFA